MHHDVKPVPELEALAALTGKWHTEGRQLEGPLGPASAFVAVETFEWLEGGHFLIHRVEGKVGGRLASCIEIFGKNERGQLFAQTFYNDGNSNSWRIQATPHEVILSGTWSKGSGAGLELRYTARVIEEGNTLEGKWEQSRDGKAWSVFMETRATKAQPLPSASIGV